MVASSSRVLVVDDHPLVCAGLATVIEREPDLTVCGQAHSSAEALASLSELQPDLITIDLSLKESNGLDLIKTVKTQHETPVLVVSGLAEGLYAERAFRAGARGYLSKLVAFDEIVRAVRKVLAGETYVSPEFSSTVAARLANTTATSPVDALTDRELEIYIFLGKGHPTRTIARRLTLSPKTVAAHKEQIKKKLGVKTSSELIVQAAHWVRENGIT